MEATLSKNLVVSALLRRTGSRGGLACPRLLDNFDAGASANTRSPGFDHLLQIFQRPHASGCFYPGASTDRLTHQPDVLCRCAGGAETRGSFDNISACAFRRQCGANLFFPAKQTRFDNDFADGRTAVAGFNDSSDIRFYQPNQVG